MPPPSSSKKPPPLAVAMGAADSERHLDFPALLSDLTSLLLLHPPASSHHGPVFSSSTLSIPASPAPAQAAPPNTPTPLARAAIGACAGAAAGAFTYAALLPIDAVKTRIQAGAASASQGSWQVFLDILRTDGPLGLYRGLSAVILGSATSSAVYFGTCELAKSLLRPNLPPFLVPPLAGASGNVSSSAIMVPKELITQRLQSGAATGRSWQVLLQILRDDGFLGLYAGYAATLLRNLPAGVLSYSSFEYLKAFTLSKGGNKANLTPGESVLCGALAGAISAALTTPLDVVKTRLMTRVGTGGSRTVVGTMREVVGEEGLMGFSRGMGPRVLHSACFAALGYCAFETARLALLNWYLEECERKAAAATKAGVAAA